MELFQKQKNIEQENLVQDMDLDNETLVLAAKANRVAFAPLYLRYVERVYRYVYSRVGNSVESEDITAQVFEDAINSLPKYQSQGRFAGWLFTLAYRRCADYHRLPGMQSITDQFTSDLANDPMEQVIRRENYQHLERILFDLKEEERELLRLHFAARLTYVEMGQVLRRNTGAIKMAMSRLIQRLKSQWEVENE